MEGDEDVRTHYRADATQLRGDDRPDLPSVMFAATLNELVHERPPVAAVCLSDHAPVTLPESGQKINEC